jgi:homoaconitase/3-isopropylmalate dehydratase large subunit
MLCRNVEHPGGPGSLLHVAAPSAVKWNRPGGAQFTHSLERDPAAIRPVIRAGDRVIVEENSAVAEARLTAVALESATVGSAFNARLEIGGKVVRAIAMRTGQALFQPQIEVRR